MNERTRERKFLARKQSSHELILAAKASNGGGHSSCSTDTTPDRGSGWPRLRGSGGVPVRARGHSVGALRGRQSPELIRPWASVLRANLLAARATFERCNGMDDLPARGSVRNCCVVVFDSHRRLSVIPSAKAGGGE